MKIPGLTDATVRENATEESYRRGDDYFQDSAVLHLEKNAPGLVEAHVQGSQHLPYTVHIRYDDEGITDVACTCPFFAGSWCKHIVATLLACLDERETREWEPSVADLLDGLDRAALVRLIERLAAREPELMAWIREERGNFD